MDGLIVEDRPYSLYRLTFPDGRLYFGITKQKPQDRWAGGRGYKGQAKIYEAIERFGWQNIRKDIVKNQLTEQEALAFETVSIRYFNTVDSGYNTAKDTCDLSKLVDCLCACLVSKIKELNFLTEIHENLWQEYLRLKENSGVS